MLSKFWMATTTALPPRGMDTGPKVEFCGIRTLAGHPLGPVCCWLGPPWNGHVLVHSVETRSAWDLGSLLCSWSHSWSCSCNVPGTVVQLGEATGRAVAMGGLCFVFNNVRWVVRVKGTSTWMPVAKVSQEIIALQCEDQWYLLDLPVVLM